MEEVGAFWLAATDVRDDLGCGNRLDLERRLAAVERRLAADDGPEEALGRAWVAATTAGWLS
jgi:hypothetical protein